MKTQGDRGTFAAEPLSAEGMERKERMLAELLAEAARVRRRRVAGVTGAACVLVGGLAVTVTLMSRPGAPGAPAEPIAVEQERPPVVAAEQRPRENSGAFKVATVGNVRGVVEKYEARAVSLVAVREVDDAALERAVRENGPEGGLVMIGGKVMAAADVLKAAEGNGPSSMVGAEVMVLAGGDWEIGSSELRCEA